MRPYSTIFSVDSMKDIKSSSDYIEFSLHNPVAADSLLEELDEELDNLEENPFICAVIDDPVLKAAGLRFSIVKNYLLFYTVSIKEKTITIIRFLNGRMNWRSILRQSFTID